MSRPDGARSPTAPAGEIVVSLLNARTICCEARGHLRVEHVLAAQREIDRLCASTPRPDRALYSGVAIESFEPGIPMRWIRWATNRTARFRRIAIVGRPGPMLAIASTFRYLLPFVPIALFADLSAALAYLDAERDDDEAAPR